MKIIKAVCVSVFCAVLLTAISSAGSVPSAEVHNPGYWSVASFGAKPNDGVDDTMAFQYAMQAGKGVYVPAGEYTIKQSLTFFNANLFGAGSEKTIITADIPDTSQPIIQAGRSCHISGITIRYKKGLVTGEESSGQRVGILCGYKYSLQRGSTIQDVKIENVGTGVYSPTGNVYGCFSVTFGNIAVTNFSYKGFDLVTGNRTGNVYKDITLQSDYPHVYSAFCFKNEESESDIEGLTVQNTKAQVPVMLDGARAFAADNIQFKNVSLTSPDSSLIVLHSSSGIVNNLTVSDCSLGDKQSLVGISFSSYGSFQTLSRFTVGCLKLQNLKMTDGSLFFDRLSGDQPYWIDVEDYQYSGSGSFYEAFPVSSSDTLQFMKKGAIAESGKTAERPAQRLCAYYTQYYDKTLQKLLTWDGSKWR